VHRQISNLNSELSNLSPLNIFPVNLVLVRRSDVDVVMVVDMQEALKACQLVNAPLLYRATKNIPYSVLKYAMTLDGTKHFYPLSKSMD
jgi:hypothetical protein